MADRKPPRTALALSPEALIEQVVTGERAPGPLADDVTVVVIDIGN